MSLKVNRLLPIYTSIVLLKFGVDIQSQTNVRVSKPKNPIWLSGGEVQKPNKGNLRNLIAAASLVILLKTGFKSLISWPIWSWNLMDGFSNKANLRDLIAATGLVISNWIQIVNFSAPVTVKFDGWPCKTIGHLFYATSSFVHHFVPIGEFKLELQSGNAQFGSKSTIFLAVWPRNFTDDPQKQ